MFSKFIGETYNIPHNFQEEVQHICILDQKRVVVFFLKTYVVCDLSKRQVISSGSCAQGNFRCMISQPVDPSTLLLYRRKSSQVCRLFPLTNTLSVLSQTSPSQSSDSFLVFHNTHLTYYIKHSQQSINLYGYETKQAITLAATPCFMDKFNENQSVVIFSQTLGSNAFTILNCVENKKRDCKLENSGDMAKYTMQFVRELQEGRVLVGWNRGEPTPGCMWVYDLGKGEVEREIPLSRLILNIYGVNLEEGIVALERNSRHRTRTLEYLSIKGQSQEVVAQVYLPATATFNAYLKTVIVINNLNIPRIASLTRIQAVSKPKCYLHLMEKTGIIRNYSQRMATAVLDLLVDHS